jgi:phosphoribosylglycinamide formyltransferase-1
VLQEPVPVHQDDTPQSLADRVLNIEHKIYPEALRLFADGHITLEGRRVLIGHPQRPSSS